MDGLNEKLRKVRHAALDMDGTIYSGKTLFPWTIPFLKHLKEMGIGYTFLTNNPSKSTTDYLKHLAGFGITANSDQLYTTVQATIEYLQELPAQPKRLFILGTPSMCREFAAAGFVLCEDSPQDRPDAVVVGFDMSLSYDRLCRAAYWIKEKTPYVATNPDRVCPTDQPTVLVDCGSICACLREATGRAPDAVMGKPDPQMLTGILHHHSLKAEELVMVGDRTYTDMLMATNAGAVGALVLTGETTAQMAADFKPAPDFVFPSLVELGEALARSRREVAV